LISSGAALAFNHLLEHDATSRGQLAAHAGARIEFRSSPFPALRLTILPDGLLSASGTTAEGDEPDLVVTLNALVIPLLAVQRNEALKQATFTGREPLADVVRELMRNARWDVEEDLSRVVGDVAAHRAMETSRQVLQWQRNAGERLARNFSEYWTEEQPLIARRTDFAAFARDVDALRAALDHIESRLAQRPPAG
jgi:ubiquinone biosynthesis protein UbiJ